MMLFCGCEVAGHRIAIDDFGTGYSSLDYLGRFPVDRIKIAESFIVNLTSTSANHLIVKAAIGLAHELNLDVVVEGRNRGTTRASQILGLPEGAGLLLLQTIARPRVIGFATRGKITSRAAVSAAVAAA